MKKIIALLAIFVPLMAIAQSLEGTWKFHPAYLMSQATEFIDTEHYIYAVTNKALVRMDKSTFQIEALTQSEGLNDVTISNIYYNYNKKYLLIAYSNSNLDFLYEDGRIANVSDLKDAVMNSSKTVNHVTFSHNEALLSTGFGLVYIDDNNLRVKEFRNYGTAVNSALSIGNKTLIATNDAIYISAGRHEQLSDFSPTGINIADAKLCPIDDNNFFAYGTSNLMRCVIDSANTVTATTIVAATPTNGVQRTPDGWLANFRANSYYYTIKNDESFSATKVAGNNTSLFSCSPDNDGTTWQIDANGIHIKGNTTYYKPEGIHFRNNTSYPFYYVYYHSPENKFYVTTVPQRRPFINSNTAHLCYVMTYNGEEWVDETPTAALNYTKMSEIVFVPWQPNVYFLSGRNTPVLRRIVDGQQDFAFTAGTHIPLTNLVQPRLAFDSVGNLWLCTTRSVTTSPLNMAYMLPKDKVLQPTITKDDWIGVSIPNLSDGSFQNQLFVIGKGDIKVTNAGEQQNYSTAWRGIPDENGDGVEVRKLSQLIDQNGKAIENYQNWVYTMTVDSTGYIWMGGSRSPVYYFDPSEAFDNNFRVTRPNLLEGDEDPYSVIVYHIAVDPQNRKWICTAENGLFVVSPDGSTMLKHFDVDNGLPSSKVYYCAASDTRAIITTDNGIAEFNMSEIPDAVDYTTVTAAPMLVEPGYTGYVIIGQVESGAVVRITDRDGNLVREFTATGNQVAWDTCREDGERVPTGVYNIYAGRSADQLPGTPQVRVKVIK